MTTKTAREKFEELMKEEWHPLVKLKLERAFTLGQLDYIETELKRLQEQPRPKKQSDYRSRESM